MTSASGMPDALAALAADPAGTRLGLTLPPGRLVSAYPDDEGPAGPPVYWLSDVEPTPGTWARLRARHGGCGLWPLLLGGLSGDERRPWQDGEVSRAELSDPATLDPDRVLAEWWAGSTDVSEERSDADPANLVELGESTEPYPRWPGLAEPGRPPEAAPDADPAATTAADTLADAVADDLLSHARRH